MQPLTRTGLAVGAVVALGLGTGAFLARRTDAPKLWNGKPIPKGGFWTDPQGRNLGDPRNAERDLRRIYAAMVGFRKRTGRLPDLIELMGDTEGTSKVGLTPDDLKNPDARYADGYRPSENLSTYMFPYIGPRPDGTPKPALPARGERDVWVACRDYERNNQFVRDDGSSTEDLRGFQMVLWSDGTIERVTPDRMVLRRESARASVFEYPGQAGLPKDVIPYGEFSKKTGVASSNEIRIGGRPL